MTAPTTKIRGVGSVRSKIPIVSASRDSKVGGGGVDEESHQEGRYDSCIWSQMTAVWSQMTSVFFGPLMKCWLSILHRVVYMCWACCSCPLNPRNKGALLSSSLHSATTEPTPTVGTCSSKTEHGSDSPCGSQLQIVNSAAARTTSECYVTSPHRLSEHSVGVSSSVGSSKERACDGDESSSQVDFMPVEPPIQTKICKCGSATHLRTTSKLCPLNLHNCLLKNQRGSDSGAEDLIIGDTEPGTVGPRGPLAFPEWMSGVKLHLYHTKSGDHYNRVVPQLCDLSSAGSEPPRCNCGSCGVSHKRTRYVHITIPVVSLAKKIIM